MERRLDDLSEREESATNRQFYTFRQISQNDQQHESLTQCSKQDSAVPPASHSVKWLPLQVQENGQSQLPSVRRGRREHRTLPAELPNVRVRKMGFGATSQENAEEHDRGDTTRGAGVSSTAGKIHSQHGKI